MRHFFESKMKCDCGDVGDSCGTKSYCKMEMIHSFIVMRSERVNECCRELKYEMVNGTFHLDYNEFIQLGHRLLLIIYYNDFILHCDTHK